MHASTDKNENQRTKNVRRNLQNIYKAVGIVGISLIDALKKFLSVFPIFWVSVDLIHQSVFFTVLFCRPIGKHWGLERGKGGSPAKHLDTVAYKVKKMKDDAQATVLQALEAERRKEAAEQSKAHAEQSTHELEEKRKQLQREIIPLQAAADVAQEYNAGKRKPNKKDVPILAADNARLKQELEYSIKDQHDVFQLYQKTERERQSLQEDAKSLRELREQAPDKLREALAISEQRKAAKRSSPFKSTGNGWSK